MTSTAKCALCGEPMPEGEEMFKYHGYSGPCPAAAAQPGERERALELIAKAHQMVSDLCHRRREWVMSIPARPDYDPDLVIGEALTAAELVLRAAAQPGERERALRREIIGLLADGLLAAKGLNLTTVEASARAGAILASYDGSRAAAAQPPDNSTDNAGTKMPVTPDCPDNSAAAAQPPTDVTDDERRWLDEDVSEKIGPVSAERVRRLLASEAHWKARAEQLQRDFDLVYEANANWCARCERAEAALLERDVAVQRVGEAWDRYISENVGGGWYKRLGEAMAALRALSGARPEGET